MFERIGKYFEKIGKYFEKIGKYFEKIGKWFQKGLMIRPYGALDEALDLSPRGKSQLTDWPT